MSKKFKINIQLFGEEKPIIKTVDDIEDPPTKEDPPQKTVEELQKEIDSLREKVSKLEANEKVLLIENNKLFNKCLSYKENKTPEKSENEIFKKFI